MKGPLVLDTHAWVWHLASPRSFPRAWCGSWTRPGRGKPSTSRPSPPGRWGPRPKGADRLSLEPRRWLEEALRVRGIGVVPLDAGIALEAAHLDLPHPDPADRFILATALRLGAVLVTKDERLRRYAKARSLWG